MANGGKMATRAPQSPLTEPVMVDCLYVTGTAIESDEHVVRIVGWVEMPHLMGSETEERRIVVRVAMAAPTARDLCDDLKGRLWGGKQ
jgi:hypothetical protein